MKTNVVESEQTYGYSAAIYPVKLSNSYLQEPLPVRLAMLLMEIVQNADPHIGEDEWIVGWQKFVIPPLLDHPNYLSTPEEIKNLDQKTGIFTTWQEIASSRHEGYAFADYGKGHVIYDYERVLQCGFEGIMKEVKLRLAQVSDAHTLSYGNAFLLCCQAAITLGRRYAEQADALALRATDAASVQRLKAIATVCRRIPAEPAASFHDALQSVWFTHLLINMENAVQASSFGRMDQYLLPYYEADRRRGMTDEALKAQLFSFLNKICGFLDYTFESNMPITIGGVTSTGSDATNALTWHFLEFIEQNRLPEPKITLRVHKNTPLTLLRYATRILGYGTGSPQLVNDDYIIPMLKEYGLSHLDAVDYGMVGCTGPSAVQGKELGWESGGGFINLAKILENYLIHMNDEPESFTSLLNGYRNAIKEFVDPFIAKINRVDRFLPEAMPTPFESLLMVNCLEKLTDMGSGCVTYNFTHYPGAGLANVANSLLAIKKLVYEDRELRLGDWQAALKADYNGYAWLRERIKSLSQYGNDEQEADGIAAEIAGYYLSEIGRHANGRGGRCRGGLASYSRNIGLGEKTGALPDGKMCGQPLAQGLAPAQGTKKVSPTAVIHSVAKVTKSGGPTNVAFTFSLPPEFFQEEEMSAKTASIFRTYFQQGGMQIQVNAITGNTLRKALQRPEQYRDLVVRVCGYSAYFVKLPKSIQQEMVSRYAD